MNDKTVSNVALGSSCVAIGIGVLCFVAFNNDMIELTSKTVESLKNAIACFMMFGIGAMVVTIFSDFFNVSLNGDPEFNEPEFSQFNALSITIQNPIAPSLITQATQNVNNNSKENKLQLPLKTNFSMVQKPKFS